jgi:thioredoxin-dependent peroxiredoxin
MKETTVLQKSIPDVTLKTRVRDESIGGDNPFRWQDLRVREEFAGKTVVVFSLPGAFTPNFSNDEVYCVSVNDAFVMYQWGKHLGLSKVKLLPDGSGAFTRRMGMLINKDHVGFGMRSWRYAMVVEDNEVTHWFEEPGINDEGADQDPYGETAPEKLLDALDAWA